MTLPTQITTGFEFVEAIDLAEFTARARQVFAHHAGDEAKTLYNLLFKGEEWDCLHAASANRTNALLLKRGKMPQFALVLDVAQATGQVTPGMAVAPTSPEQAVDELIAITNIATDSSPAQQPTVSDDSVEYLPLDGEQTFPLRGARLYRPWQQAFAAIQADLELFFDTATSPQPPQAAPAKTSPSKTRNKTQPVTVDLSDGFALYIAGHGAGGCVAALAALHLQRAWESQLDFPTFWIKLYTFGSPKLGNRAFVDVYNRQMKGFSYRVQNLLDRVTYEPLPQAPFPYNLQTMLPGVDYVRQGTHYFTTYEHVGDLIALPGIGRLPQNFNFSQGLKALTPQPFPHDAAGYKALLSEAQSLQAALMVPAQQAATWLNAQKAQLLATFQKQAATVQTAAAKFQDKTSA
ncbi:MAG: hypothetical protein NT075_18540 [Chloroflexi bacterium]|nr:hypothetical protein [Chloroflexota bacterium]